MNAVETDGVTADRCEGCGGLWFDDRELAEALRAAASRPAAGAVDFAGHGSINLLCPRCKAATSEYNFAYDSGVLINECPACRGVFLQRGEFEEIAAFKARLAEVARQRGQFTKMLPPVEQPDRFSEWITSKPLFLSTFVVLLCLAMAITGRVIVTLATFGIYMIFPLICFWFADVVDGIHGLRFGHFRTSVKEPAPGIAIAMVAWFCLFALFVATIVS